MRIWNRVVLANPQVPTKAIFSPLFTEKLRSLSTSTPSTCLHSPSTSRMTLPQGRSGLKATQGYLRDDTGISSTVIFSSSFLRAVACLALEALEEKRWINSFNSAAFADDLVFSRWRWVSTSWLAWYQKS